MIIYDHRKDNGTESVRAEMSAVDDTFTVEELVGQINDNGYLNLGEITISVVDSLIYDPRRTPRLLKLTELNEQQWQSWVFTVHIYKDSLIVMI